MKKELIKLTKVTGKETIYDIHERMQILCDFFEKNEKYRGFLAFLKTYEMVTQKVMEKSLDKNYFRNVEKIRELDVVFAGLYFKPLNNYVNKKQVKEPWKNSFKVTSKNQHLPFVQMLVGISSHINGDLPVALLKSNYKEHEDFLKVNKILLDTIPQLMEFLSFHEHDFIAAGGLLFQQFVREEFHKTVVKWRLDAWKNFQALKKNKEKKKELRQKTEEVNKKLIEIFNKFEKFENLTSFVDEINKISVLI
jgi:hypothetical protein